MNGRVYCDTSALAKWYVHEVNSEKVADFLQREGSATISTLTALEMRCLLARRRRASLLSAELEGRIFATFEQDIEAGHLLMYPLDDHATKVGLNFIALLSDHALRTLDALHLAIARDLGCPRLATADRAMADAAEALGFDVKRFD